MLVPLLLLMLLVLLGVVLLVVVGVVEVGVALVGVVGVAASCTQEVLTPMEAVGRRLADSQVTWQLT